MDPLTSCSCTLGTRHRKGTLIQQYMHMNEMVCRPAMFQQGEVLLLAVGSDLICCIAVPGCMRGASISSCQLHKPFVNCQPAQRHSPNSQQHDCDFTVRDVTNMKACTTASWVGAYGYCAAGPTRDHEMPMVLQEISGPGNVTPRSMSAMWDTQQLCTRINLLQAPLWDCRRCIRLRIGLAVRGRARKVVTVGLSRCQLTEAQNRR